MENSPNNNLNSDFKDLTNSETKDTIKISKKSETSEIEVDSVSENILNNGETYIESFKDSKSSKVNNDLKQQLEQKNKDYDLLKSELEQIKQIVQTIQDTPKTENTENSNPVIPPPIPPSTPLKKSNKKGILNFSLAKKSPVPPDGNEDPLLLLQQLQNMFNEIKILLKKMIEFINKYQSQININEQDDDDIKFYTSIIINSKNYFISSHKAREKKLIYDLNSILKTMSKNKLNKIYKFNKSSVDIISNTLTKIKEDVDMYKSSLASSKPKWRKDDKNKQFDTIETEMRRSFNYHISVNKYFYNCLKKELEFFDIKN